MSRAFHRDTIVRPHFGHANPYRRYWASKRWLQCIPTHRHVRFPSITAGTGPRSHLVVRTSTVELAAEPGSAASDTTANTPAATNTRTGTSGVSAETWVEPIACHEAPMPRCV